MAVNSYTATTNLTKVYRYIRSVSLVETAGTPAATRWQLRDGTDSTNDIVKLAIGCGASGSQTITMPQRPMFFPKGVRLEVISGSGRVTIDGY